MMNRTYPFNIQWSGYSDADLIREALRPVKNDLDRDDLVNLLEEVGKRWQESQDEIESLQWKLDDRE